MKCPWQPDMALGKKKRATWEKQKRHLGKAKEPLEKNKEPLRKNKEAFGKSKRGILENNGRACVLPDTTDCHPL